MLFLDGVGLGSTDGSVNPFFAANTSALRSLFDGKLPSLLHPDLTANRASLVPLDANLGIEGLPQSGTGQTTLFTGLNASKMIGKHFGPHPYSTLRPVIQDRNIFKQLLGTGKRPCFANAFPQRFFDYISIHQSRMTVTTLSCTSSGVPLLTSEDLRHGKAISADITSEGWNDLGYPDVPVLEPTEAGKRLVELLQENDFVLFEYWKTDYAGHSENFTEAVAVIERLDELLAGIIETMDTDSTLLFVTSDHGNLEDMTTKTHTRNPVPAILYGFKHDTIAAELRESTSTAADLTRVTPLLMKNIVVDAV